MDVIPNNQQGEEESSPTGVAKYDELPENAIPLFTDSYGNTAFIKNIPNPQLPKSVNQSETTPIYKSVREHRHLTTLAEARAFTKMSHPSEGFKGSERPDLESIEKSMQDSVIGNGKTVVWTKEMSPSVATSRDWAEFDRFRKRGRI